MGHEPKTKAFGQGPNPRKAGFGGVKAGGLRAMARAGWNDCWLGQQAGVTLSAI